MEKADGAFLTISELAATLGVAPHVLRYWETRFPKLRPLTRAGNRRYYRPEDVVLVSRINQLLNRENYTIKGAQKLLDDKNLDRAVHVGQSTERRLPTDALTDIRDRLAAALNA